MATDIKAAIEALRYDDRVTPAEFIGFVREHLSKTYRQSLADAICDLALAALDAYDPERERRIEELEAAKNGAYAERDRLVCALSKVFPSWLARHPDDDTSWDNDWRWIVFVQLPTGQASWHIHDSERGWFDHLLVGENSWDGHTTEEKYDRVAALMRTAPADGRLRELRDWLHREWLGCIEAKKAYAVNTTERRECQAEANAIQRACFEADRLLATPEPAAADARLRELRDAIATREAWNQANFRDVVSPCKNKDILYGCTLANMDVISEIDRLLASPPSTQDAVPFGNPCGYQTRHGDNVHGCQKPTGHEGPHETVTGLGVSCCGPTQDALPETSSMARDPSAIADLVVQDVAEIPYRTSPDDWPEAMIVTAEELHAFVVRRVRGADAEAAGGEGLLRAGGSRQRLIVAIRRGVPYRPGMDQSKLIESSFPHYQSHKIVQAAKIVACYRDDAGGGKLQCLLPHGDTGRDDVVDVIVPPEFWNRHDPQPGGYLVRYADGYLSWSPAEAFEGGYLPLGESGDEDAQLAVQIDKEPALRRLT